MTGTPAVVDWTDAACFGQPEELFFPPPHTARKTYASSAARFCDRCPIRVACADYAITNDIVDGLWGGLAPEERRALTQRRAAVGGRARTARCGTPSGYDAHLRNAEPTCSACRDAQAAKMRRWRSRTTTGDTPMAKPGDPMEPIAVNFRDAAAMTSLSVPTIHRRVADGTIKAVRIGGRIVIPVAELRRLVEGDSA